MRWRWLLSFIIISCSFLHYAAADDASEYKYTYNLNDESNCSESYDPYEQLNRKFFTFNSFLDYIISRPIAVGYKYATNDFVRARIGGVLENIMTPLTTVNYTLQFNGTGAVKSLWRFFLNTTFGLGGMFDVASKLGIETTPQTFGSTLAHYGVGPGPYLVLPIFGGTNARDVTDTLFLNNALNPVRYPMHKDFRLAVTSTKLVHDREELLQFTDYVGENSTDPYIAIRSAIHQNRESKISYPENFICPINP